MASRLTGSFLPNSTAAMGFLETAALLESASIGVTASDISKAYEHALEISKAVRDVQIAHIDRIAEWVVQNQSLGLYDTPIFLRNASADMQANRLKSENPLNGKNERTLKWLLKALDLMNEVLEYESSSDNGGFFGKFFARRDGEKVETNSKAQITWLFALAELWNERSFGTSHSETEALHSVNVSVFVSADHMWIGFDAADNSLVQVELCCTPSSNRLLLAEVNGDSSMLFRNTQLDNRKALFDDVASSPSLSDSSRSSALDQFEFLVYLSFTSAISMIDHLELVSSSAIDIAESRGLVNIILGFVGDIIAAINSLESDGHYHHSTTRAFLCAKLTTRLNILGNKPGRGDYLKDMAGFLRREGCQYTGAIEAYDEAVQLNAEHYLARKELVLLYMKTDTYLAYKHASYLLDQIGIYNENGLTSKCQDIYNAIVAVYQQLIATGQFNPSSERDEESNIVIPYLGNDIVVTWDVQFEDDPDNVQTFEYDATLGIKMSSSNAVTRTSDGLLVADSAFPGYEYVSESSYPFPRLYVTYPSTSEMYYIRFKSDAECEHLMNDGQWERFPYYVDLTMKTRFLEGSATLEGDADGATQPPDEEEAEQPILDQSACDAAGEQDSDVPSAKRQKLDDSS